MASQTEWPQALKDFAERAFAACTDANRAAVSEELRSLIFQAYQANTIHSTDWSSIQLKSLSTGAGKKALKRSADEVAQREKRARRFEREQRQFHLDQEQNSIAPTPPIASGSGSGSRLASRMGVASASASASASAWSSTPPEPENGVIDWDEHTVVGTSTKLEKPYLRLTSAPDPRTVRPLSTLKQTLELLKRKWRTESNYAYICDQFKSMRQDLTVQRIKNDFTVKVYEIHARIALEKGDLGEYNQCQSQLRSLYAYDIPGCVMEFLAYRILYLLHTKNRRDVNALMAELTAGHKAEPAVAHALAVRSALVTGNFHALFKLYDKAPNMNAYVMDHFVERERMNALLVMARCYRPSIGLQYIADQLGFDGAAEAHAFLDAHGAAVYVDPTPAQAQALALALGGGGGGKRGAKAKVQAQAQVQVQVPMDQRNWDAKAAVDALYQAMEKYRKVDIKGQI